MRNIISILNLTDLLHEIIKSDILVVFQTISNCNIHFIFEIGK